jgi:hypothetical protein
MVRMLLRLTPLAALSLVLLALPTATGAGTPTPSLEATSVALDPTTACGPDPWLAETAHLDLGLVADAPLAHLEAEVSNLHGGSQTARSEVAGIGPIDGVVEDLQVPVDASQHVVQILVWMGADAPDATTAVEWSVFYACEDGELVVGASCFGPYGSCPRTRLGR